MGLVISDFQIDRVCIVDDDDTARDSYRDSLYDSPFETFSPDSNISDPSIFFEGLRSTDAVLTDHQLKKKSYFPLNGAELVASCFSRHIPSILITRYDKVQMAEIRRFRRKIPVLINPADFDVDELPKKLEICINEFKGNLRTERKLHRTLARMDSFDEMYLYFIIPAWDPSEMISIERSELPSEINKIVREDNRLFVEANIGAEDKDDLFFENWEIKE
jgi:hypothetical protein